MANDKDPCVRLAVWPEPDAAPCRVEDKLRIDAGPGFGNAERGPLADEPRRPGGAVATSTTTSRTSAARRRPRTGTGPARPARNRGPACRRRRTAGQTGRSARLRPGQAARRAGVPRSGRCWTGSARVLGTAGRLVMPVWRDSGRTTGSASSLVPDHGPAAGASRCRGHRARVPHWRARHAGWPAVRALRSR